MAEGAINFAGLTRQQFSDLARNFQTANFSDDPLVLMRRFHLMFERAEPNGHAQQKLGMGPADWFSRIAGIEPRWYRILQLVAMSHASGFRLEEPDLRRLVYDLDRALERMAPTMAIAYRELHQLAVGEKDMPDNEFHDWSAVLFGSYYLRRRPVLRLSGEKYLCLHKQLFIERFFGGTVHVLADLVTKGCPPSWHVDPRNRTSRVRTEFGVIFEDFIQRLIKIIFHGTNAVFRFNVKPDCGGECDAVLVIDETALVIEVVHHPWSIEERYRASPSDFIKHLEDNVRKSTKLSTELTIRGSLADDPRVRVARAFPITIMAEAMPINHMTAATFESELISVVGEGPVKGTDRVLPVQSLSVTQLENLDRAWTDNPRQILTLLERRAGDPLQRFNANPNMGWTLGPWRYLDQIDDEAQRSLQEIGPAAFLN